MSSDTGKIEDTKHAMLERDKRQDKKHFRTHRNLSL